MSLIVIPDLRGIRLPPNVFMWLGGFLGHSGGILQEVPQFQNLVMLSNIVIDGTCEVFHPFDIPDPGVEVCQGRRCTYLLVKGI